MNPIWLRLSYEKFLCSSKRFAIFALIFISNSLNLYISSTVILCVSYPYVFFHPMKIQILTHVWVNRKYNQKIEEIIREWNNEVNLLKLLKSFSLPIFAKKITVLFILQKKTITFIHVLTRQHIINVCPSNLYLVFLKWE